MKNQPIDVDAIVRKFEQDLADPNSDIQILTHENAVEKAKADLDMEQARRERVRRNFFRRTR